MWRRKTAVVHARWIDRQWRNIAYADISPTQTLDIYLPNDGDGPFPVLFFIHGGAFKFGDKADRQILPVLEGVKRGYAVVSINYRLSGEAVWPAQIYDAKAALRWVKAHADTYGFDTGRIAAWGPSAGGHLAALLGTSQHIAELEDTSMGNPDEDTCVHAVVDWFGPISFLSMDEQFLQNGLNGQKHSTPDSFESKLIGVQITTCPEIVAQANPETYITDAIPPFLIQHGDNDTVIPVQQSEEFARKLQAVAGTDKILFDILPGAKHADRQFGDPKQNLVRVFDFLDSHLLK